MSFLTGAQSRPMEPSTWKRVVSVLMILGMGAFVVGCSTMEDVREPAPAYFSVEITDVPETVTEGEEVTVRYMVRNTGERSGTQDIDFDVGGAPEATNRDVRIEPNQAIMGEFSYMTRSEDVGNLAVVISTDQDSASAIIRVEPEPVVIRGDVLFEFDRAEIREEFAGELNEIAQRLVDNPDQQIRIVGHTDSVGSDSYNQRLSERRAQSVADYLAERNVERHRMSIEGRGEREPVASNATAEGREQNRRVEIHTY